MTDVPRLSPKKEQLIARYLPRNHHFKPADIVETPDGSSLNGSSKLPFVTLTYALSLDGMISIEPGKRTVLSGAETKSMTHFLRLHHDAILVGVGTAIADDPSLNCRYPGATIESQPQPVILDSTGRWDINASKVLSLHSEGKGKEPWRILTSQRVERPSGDPKTANACDVYLSQEPKLASASDAAPMRCSWDAVLEHLKASGIDSVMIEGGATVIEGLLARPELVDVVIITIAPTWLGQGGVTVSPAARTHDGLRVNPASLLSTEWQQFGNDVVLFGNLDHSA